MTGDFVGGDGAHHVGERRLAARVADEAAANANEQDAGEIGMKLGSGCHAAFSETEDGAG